MPGSYLLKRINLKYGSKLKKMLVKIRFMTVLPQAYDILEKLGARFQKETRKLWVVKILKNCELKLVGLMLSVDKFWDN